MILPNKSVVYYYTELYKEWDGKGLDGPMTNFYNSAVHFWLSQAYRQCWQ